MVWYLKEMRRLHFPTTDCGNPWASFLPMFYKLKCVSIPNYGQYWSYFWLAWSVTYTLKFKNGEKRNSNPLKSTSENFTLFHKLLYIYTSSKLQNRETQSDLYLCCSITQIQKYFYTYRKTSNRAHSLIWPKFL